eukprot:3213824-Rhodomonas_salina.2
MCVLLVCCACAACMRASARVQQRAGSALSAGLRAVQCSAAHPEAMRAAIETELASFRRVELAVLCSDLQSCWEVCDQDCRTPRKRSTHAQITALADPITMLCLRSDLCVQVVCRVMGLSKWFAKPLVKRDVDYGHPRNLSSCAPRCPPPFQCLLSKHLPLLMSAYTIS